MTHITPEQLQHLAKLSSLTISKDEEKVLLPQLEKILGFVAQLQDCDTSLPDGFSVNEHAMHCNGGIHTSQRTEDFLSNVKHPIDRQMIVLETTTNEK